MSSPTFIFNTLQRYGFKVIDWSGRSRISKRNSFDIPRKPGVYALYFGKNLQHIGSTLRGLKGRIKNQKNAQESYKPNGSVSWFALPEKQVLRAEALLIERYKPPYLKRQPRNNRRGRGL